MLIMRYMYALNRKGLKAESVYALNKGYAPNNGVRLTTRVYGTVLHDKNLVDYTVMNIILLKLVHCAYNCLLSYRYVPHYILNYLMTFTP